MNKYCYDDNKLLQEIKLSIGKRHVGFQDLSLYDDNRKREVKVGIWYPTLFDTTKFLYNDIFYGQVAFNALIIKDRFPLILFSHGSEGHRFNQHYLAEFMASHGFICASIEHDGDNVLDNSMSKLLDNLWHRPLDVKFALNSLLSHEFKNNIKLDSIGFAGHSFGGYTGLALLGATVNFANLSQYQKIENKVFQNSNNFLLNDERINCAFLMAPALSELFCKQSLSNIIHPISLVISEKDEYLCQDNIFFKDNILNMTECVSFINAGHYVYLMDCPDCPLLAEEVGCFDIGTKRKLIHPVLKLHILKFFSQNFNKVIDSKEQV